MTSKSYFSPPLFAFLRQLAANNNREWFAANKARYESDVRDPMLRFIRDFAPRLAQISDCFVADPRPTGGSLFRIYRDTRFAKDKTPYKTHVAAHFRHEVGKDVHAPGFYLHLEPNEVFVGAGIWHPDTAALTKLRRAIVAAPARWSAIVGNAKFKRDGELGGDTLKRPPAGVPADHPLIEDLKRKDFVWSVTFAEKDACSPKFIERYAAACATAAPLVQFLTRALGLPW
jgi:uncharacterized protein (TIGR02453 family)